MILQDIDFGPCLDGSGIRGFKGEGFWYHHVPPMNLLLNFNGSTFVSKTATVRPRFARNPPEDGNMPIHEDAPWGPTEWFPRCIWFGLLSGRTVNAVNLSGPGIGSIISFLLERDAIEPFVISIMCVGKLQEERREEMRYLVSRIAEFSRTYRSARFAVQLNISCPNTGHDPALLAADAQMLLDEAYPLSAQGIPLMVKLNCLTPISAVVALASHENCDALCSTNTIPFGEMEDIEWQDIFPDDSPILARNRKYGKGGYSGPELLQLNASFIRRVKAAGVQKPWNAGGGIRSATDVRTLARSAGLRRGIDSIFFASAVIVRPWRVRSIISAAHRYLD